MKYKTEAEWHAIREMNVGGSEIASLFYRWRYIDGQEIVHHMYEAVPPDAVLLGSLSLYTTGYRLWQEKSGKLMPDDLSGAERIEAGKHLEPAIAEWSRTKYDWHIRKVRRYCTHDTVKGWGASLDYEIKEPGMPPVEIKNVDFLVYRDYWLETEGEIVMPPLHILLQVQHQIGAVGADSGWIVACIGGNKLERGRIARHEATQAKIAEAIEAFWHGVDNGIQPKWLADYETVAKVYAHGQDTPDETALDLSGDNKLPGLISEYKALQARMDEQKEVLSNIKGQIAVRLGEATRAVCGGWRMSWPRIEREKKTIPAKEQEALTYRGGLTITAIKEQA